MILRTGRLARRGVDPSSRGFTLIELILVMSMMLVILSLTAPALTGFFRGRTLDSEARRLLALTRYAQNRAVAESIPMILWIDERERRYGVEAEYTFTPGDERAVEFAMADDVNIAVTGSAAQPVASTSTSTSGSGASAGVFLSREGLRIRFTPDGFLSDLHPQALMLTSAERAGTGGAGLEDGLVVLAPNRSRVHYEILTNLYAVYR